VSELKLAVSICTTFHPIDGLFCCTTVGNQIHPWSMIATGTSALWCYGA
uniref:Uncharacterized protein n=1 Tax=Aegilops tauschii subsp. strangulata TaxID=200361 RepID=A0A453ACP5_AEGTS